MRMGGLLTPFYHHNAIDNHPIGLRTSHPGDARRFVLNPKWVGKTPTFRRDFIHKFFSSARNTNNFDENDTYNRVETLVDGTMVQRKIKYKTSYRVTRFHHDSLNTSEIFDKHILNGQMYHAIDICPYQKLTDEQLITLKYWYQDPEEVYDRLSRFRLNDCTPVTYEALVAEEERRFGPVPLNNLF